jgi:kynureninase
MCAGRGEPAFSHLGLVRSANSLLRPGFTLWKASHFSQQPVILSTLAMEASLDLVLEAGIERIRNKSMRMTAFLIYLFDQILAPLGFSLGTPRDPEQRGSHVSIRHPEGYRINRALIEELALIPDFRQPDNIRLGLSPLYTSYSEVWEGVERIRRALVEDRYKHFSTEAPGGNLLSMERQSTQP